MNKLLLVIFLFSCGHLKKADKVQENQTTMEEKFKLIDKKLKSFAEEFNADIYNDGFGTGLNGVLRTENVEVRRIIWFDDSIGKAVLIIPFPSKDTSESRWRFANVAWLEKKQPGSNQLPFWDHDLLLKVKFEEIEKNIDQLLAKSKENLQRIKREDLK